MCECPHIYLPLSIAIRIELLSDDKPCSTKNPAILKCTYDLDAHLPNGDHKYSSSQPSWRENGMLILLTDPRYHISLVSGLTSAMLYVDITREGPVEYSCFLLLNDGFNEEESNKIVVIHKGKYGCSMFLCDHLIYIWIFLRQARCAKT